VVGDSGGRCFCRKVLITLVKPLHRPSSANAATSVCLNREQERSLRCRPIIRPCPTAGLCISCTRHPVGDCVLPSRSQPEFQQVPYNAGDPATARRFTRPSARDVDQLSSSIRRFPGSSSGGQWPLRFPGRAPPYPPLAVLGVPPLLCRSIDGVPA